MSHTSHACSFYRITRIFCREKLLCMSQINQKIDPLLSNFCVLAVCIFTNTSLGFIVVNWSTLAKFASLCLIVVIRYILWDGIIVTVVLVTIDWLCYYKNNSVCYLLTIKGIEIKGIAVPVYGICCTGAKWPFLQNITPSRSSHVQVCAHRYKVLIGGFYYPRGRCYYSDRSLSGFTEHTPCNRCKHTLTPTHSHPHTLTPTHSRPHTHTHVNTKSLKICCRNFLSYFTKIQKFHIFL